MRYIQFVVFLFCFLYQSEAQQNNSFQSSEDSLAVLFKDLRGSQNDDDKISVNNRIISQFKKLFEQEGSFNYLFDSLKMTARVYAPDKAFRIITWNIFLSSGEYKYFGFIQTAGNKVFELTDRTGEVQNFDNSVLSPGKWLGAFYYKILRNKVDDKVYYTILSLQYHNIVTTRKFVEILYFDQWGNPVFGAPIIQANSKLYHRMVLEYSAMVAVNLRYDEKKKMIIFDHLAPTSPEYAGMFQYYGPDMTFDALEFKKNKWQYISNIDLRMQSDPTQGKRSPR